MEQKTELKKYSGLTFGNLFRLVILFMLLLAVFSHSKTDIAILEGGMGAEHLLQNWIGLIGAQTSRILFYLFGLAVYPCLVLLSLSVFRRFLPIPLKRNGFAGFFLLLLLGLSILFAMKPERFIGKTDELGIGRMEQSALALSGGVVGSALAAPPDGEMLEAGLVRRYLGEVGALVIAFSLILPALGLMFFQDWWPVCQHFTSDHPAPSESARRKDDTPEPEPESEPEPVEQDTSEEANQVGAPQEFNLKNTLKQLFGLEMNSSAPEPPPSVQTDEDTPVAPPQNILAKQDAGSVPAEKPEQNSVPHQDEDSDYSVAPPVCNVETKVPPAVIPDVPAEKTESASAAEEESPKAVSPADVAPVNVKLYSQEKSAYDKMKPDSSSFGEDRKASSTEVHCENYVLPPVVLLDKQNEVHTEDTEHIERSREKLQATLGSFNVDGHVSEIVVGPRVTRFEISLAPGVKVEKVTSIQSNIAMDLAAESLRILAPIPGKTAVGIEVPNKVSSIVYLRSLMESPVWKESRASIPIILGRDIAGKVMVTDLAKAPHLLIAGSTGSGKSVCMNTLVMSLLFKFSPEDLRLIMVDPKVVELEMYRPLPHLITPVVNDPKKVPLALRWGVNEMERRYKVLAKVKAKNLAAFNSRPQDSVPVYDDDDELIPQHLPFVIIIIDELADIMMTEAKSDVETSICRIAQKGRAAGIHLVIATQTPRKDVITGLIKANLPTKIAFKVGSNMDSRVILDCGGAEKLLGMGDMLFLPPGAAGLERIQGSMVSDPEIQKVVDFVSDQCEQNFNTQVMAEDVEIKNGEGGNSEDDEDEEDDISQHVSAEFVNSVAAKYLEPGDSDLMRKALEIIINEQQVSTSYLQRRLGIGYNRAASLIDDLERRGIVSAPLPGGQKREILITDGLETNE